MEVEELHYKLILTPSDKDTFIRLIEDKELPLSSSRRLVESYQFFDKRIRESGIDPGLLYKGVARLTIADFSLDRSSGNPQLIFESLSSSGLDPMQADLVRNCVFMRLGTDMQNGLDYGY
jgi:uncharacterized protein with ParB-like and HNH nuclease domain